MQALSIAAVTEDDVRVTSTRMNKYLQQSAVTHGLKPAFKSVPVSYSILHTAKLLLFAIAADAIGAACKLPHRKQRLHYCTACLHL
jgi:hypothetical protein